MDYYVKSVIPIIESNYENFTALEKNIADFFMKNEEKMDFSAKEIAKHSQVPMKMDRRFRHMVVESARYLLLCIMQLSVQN